jgi:antitoxin component of RelBE/YafQ-DinJ toxin-antitoxin module
MQVKRGTRGNGIYKEMLQVRIPRKMKTLMENRAREKGMTISEYVRFLIHKDLETQEGAYEK